MAVRTRRPDPIMVTTDDGCRLELRRHPGTDPHRPVLLVHGASANSDTFRIGEQQTLVDFLLRARFDVWTLDWRASNLCARSIYCNGGAAAREGTLFTIDAAATLDVPAAIRAMRAATPAVRDKIGVVAHCMGGAIVAQGIAQGAIAGADVDHVVLTALGLFYRAAIDNVMKAEDRALEQLLFDGQHLLHPTRRWASTVCAQDPGAGPWDPLLQRPYEVWLQTPLPHDCTNELCHRLSYMFGMPFLADRIPSIHDGHLPELFGYIPLKFLLHCCQNLRRGHAAPFVPNGGERTLPPDHTYLKPEAFRDRALTLITGDLNSLWHRDSIDTMYEWLRRGRRADQPRRLDKHVLAGYGHQDLHWAAGAPDDIFPRIVRGLEG